MDYTELMLRAKYGDRFYIVSYNYNVSTRGVVTTFKITLRDFYNDPNETNMEFNLSFKTLTDPVLLWEALFEQLQKIYPIHLDGNDIMKELCTK